MKEKIRILALVMALAACVSLSACGGRSNEDSTPSNIGGEPGSNANSENQDQGETNNGGADSATPNVTDDGSGGDSNGENVNDGSQTEETPAEELYVAKVTTVNDDGSLLLTLCTAADESAMEITDHAKVDMSKFTPSGTTLNYTIPDDANISRAKDGTQEESSADDIAAGDMLIVYSEKGSRNIVIYPAA